MRTPRNAQTSESYVWLNIDGPLAETIDALNALHEHVLHEPVGFLDVGVVMPLMTCAPSKPVPPVQ